MAVLVLGLLILAMAGHSSANWCVCKQGLQSQLYQGAIDYACGAGADCNPIKPNGQCASLNSIQGHCSYAVNSYYQKKKASGATCDFGGVAILSPSDPSVGSCAFPASSGGVGTGTGTSTAPGSSTSPVTTVPTTSPSTPTTTPVTPVSGTGTGTGTGTGSPVSGGVGVTPSIGTSPTTTNSPYSTGPNAGTPSNGVLGGVGPGLGPTASSMDENYAGIKLDRTSFGSAVVALVISGILCLWN